MGLGSLELATAAGALLVTVGAGTVAHELSHAAVLRVLGVSCAVSWFSRSDASGTSLAGLGGNWATVTPRSIPSGFSPWGLRLAAIAPLALATPALLVLVGVLPDPVGSDDPVLVASTVAWLGCALPSPRDFSVFWYADRALAEAAKATVCEE